MHHLGDAPAERESEPVKTAPADAPTRLRKAVETVDHDPAAAIAELEGLAAEYGLLEDYVLYIKGIAHRKNGEAKPAIAALERVIDRFSDSPVTPGAAAELADVRLASGDGKKVLALAKRFAKTDEPRDAIARISFAAGQVLSDHDPERAAQYFTTARRLFTDTGAAKLAGEALKKLRIHNPKLEPRSAEQLLEEIGYLGREARIGEQAKVVERFLHLYPGHPRQHSVLMLRARGVAFSDGKKPAADYLMSMVERTAGKEAKAKLVFESAIYDWNANFNTEALKKFQTVLRMNTGIAEEQRCHYASGRIHESQRRFTHAASAYRAASEGKDKKTALEAEWRSGWASYLAGNFTGATFVFARLAAKIGETEKVRGRPVSTVATGRDEALYWQARSLERDGNEKGAAEIYRKVLREAPDGFYAYLTEKRKGMRVARPSVETVADALGKLTRVEEHALARARALRAANLGEYIVDELKPLTATKNVARARALLPILAELGAHGLAMQKSLELYRRGKLSEEELYTFLYPHAYAEIVTAETESRGISPFLIYAVMRQESAFNTNAVSSANACGLMQLLPSTARRMAPKAGVTAEDCRDLFDPERNIKLGVTYLETLASMFNSDPILMLAGYNAGESAAGRWKDRNAGMDEDEFIERISYTETRGYVKKILRNYRNYARLYARPGHPEGAGFVPDDTDSGSPKPIDGVGAAAGAVGSSGAANHAIDATDAKATK